VTTKEASMPEITGGCHCGAVRYTLAGDALPPVYACHCRTCQTWSGSAFTEQCFVKEDALSVTGPVALYEFTSPSGSTSRQRMCGTCHVRIFNTNTARPGWAVLRAGTLDESDAVSVVAHIWTKRKQRWIVIPEGIPSWEESAPPESLMALVSGR